MNKRSTALFEQIVVALCHGAKLRVVPYEETTDLLNNDTESRDVARIVVSTAQAIVERVEAIEAEAK